MKTNPIRALDPRCSSLAQRRHRHAADKPATGSLSRLELLRHWRLDSLLPPPTISPIHTQTRKHVGVQDYHTAGVASPCGHRTIAEVRPTMDVTGRAEQAARRRPSEGRSDSLRYRAEGATESIHSSHLEPTNPFAGETQTEALHQLDSLGELHKPGRVGCAWKCYAKYVRRHCESFIGSL